MCVTVAQTLSWHRLARKPRPLRGRRELPDARGRGRQRRDRQLVADPELRARLGEAGRRTAQDDTWERRIDELEAFLDGIAKPRAMSFLISKPVLTSTAYREARSDSRGA
jgi:hypothetical protein